MMDMSYSTGPAVFFSWGLHVLGGLLFFVGVLLLILWAVKTLTPTQLKTWGIWLAIIGTIACLISIAASPFSRMGHGKFMMRAGDDRMPMMERMMDEMMEGEHGDMMMDDAMGMSMEDMAEMLEGKTGDEFDMAFLEGMIPHHQGAIDMAKMAQTSAKHQEIKAMADAIISAQQREIDQMHQWQQAWGYAQ